MVVGSPAHKKAVQSLWVGKVTITVLDGVLKIPPMAARSPRSASWRQTSAAAFPTSLW